MYRQDEQKVLYELSKSYLEGGSAVHQHTVTQQLQDLRRLVVYHEWRYYIGNDPVISDFEYDQLYKQLEKLEELHPELVTPDSPTQRVSADLTEEFVSVEHLTPMLSLANSYDANDLNDWDAQLKRLLNIPADAPIE